MHAVMFHHIICDHRTAGVWHDCRGKASRPSARGDGQPLRNMHKDIAKCAFVIVLQARGILLKSWRLGYVQQALVNLSSVQLKIIQSTRLLQFAV